MKTVTNHFFQLISKQVKEHGLVVWYDPERYYEGALQDLEAHLQPQATSLAIYSGSFFALRCEIEPLMNDLDPPRLVVYVPMNPTETYNALAEVEIAGVIMKPGQQPPTRNTRLSLIARNALKPIVGEETALSLEKQVEAGKLTLADLDRLADKGEGITKGVVSVIFGTGNAQDVTLDFLSSDRFDVEIVNKGAAPELALLLQSAFEIDLPSGETPNGHRARLARHILTTDLVAGIQGEIPTSLTTVKIASKSAAREACTTLARTWRLRSDLHASYMTHANRVEKELGFSGIDLKLNQMTGIETFLEVERTLQRGVETALLEKARDNLVEIARTRQSSFWSEHLPDVQAHWALIVASGQVLLEADRIEKEMKSPVADAKAIFTAYTETDHRWCLLDTYHRHMERRYHNFDFDLSNRHQRLEQLTAKARQRYMEVGSTLSEHFLRCYQEAKFQIAGALHQTEIFEKRVKPRIAEGKTAYMWVDALRYEMARELAQTLSSEFDVEIQAAVGTVPTITEIGMAALLPSAHESVVVISGSGNKLALEIDGTLLKDRKDRVKFLKSHAGVEVFDAKLDDLLPNPKKKIREGIEGANLILITSQEIDALCEGDNVPLARRTMDDILHELRRAFRILAELGVESIIFTADHGYLFGDELGSDMKIDAPGGETVDLHRRVWVGHGGAADPAYLRAQLSDFDIGGELEVATPWNFSCFKVQGGTRAYFHGGLSPQELIIPVVTLISKKKIVSVPPIKVEWALIPGSQKISTRFFSVQIKGSATSLFDLIPPKVRIEIRAKGDCLSIPVSASYGFEEATGDVQLKLAEGNPK
ncbi:MAG: PglZ domain-containing protein, partial [Candidatus Tectomicrobia bacterium]|nr:PglZ domain-containing protein [Candidatus Tectomicrobia bacterium]